MPKKNKMEDLRDHLFETMEMLKDPESGMDVKKAQAIADIGRVLVDTARTEINCMKMVGAGSSDFLQINGRQLQLVGNGQKLKALNVSSESYEDLCTRCPLPDCDETSPECLIQIERRKAA